MPSNNTPRFLADTLRWLLLPLFLFFVYMMWSIIAPYIQPPYPTDIDFLETKQRALRSDIWRWSFYLHITSSLIVLASGTGQFSKYVLQNYPRWHRCLGKTYVLLILTIAAPTGLVMAFYANGAWLGQMAFVLQAIFWWCFTLLAFAKIRKGDLPAHGKWMFRSFAMSLSAVSLRAFIFIIGYLEIPLSYDQSYLLVAWLSWTFNLVLAEILIQKGAVDYFFKK